MADEQIIYLSPEEELTSVRERLERIPTRRIILVIPAQTQLRSHVSWRLLHARARELDKEILIISSDRQIRSVVKAAGFKVVGSLESSPISKNRSGSRTGRSILGGRPSSHVKTPPGRGVPNQRTNASNGDPDSTRQFEKRTSKPLDADSRRSQRDNTNGSMMPSSSSTFGEADSHFGPEINYSVPGPSTSSTPKPSVPPSIPSTPSIHPLEPSYQDEEPDLFLEDFRRAQSIREAAQKNDPDRMVSPPPHDDIPPDSTQQIFDLPFEEREGDDPLHYIDDDDDAVSLPEQHGSVSFDELYDSGVDGVDITNNDTANILHVEDEGDLGDFVHDSGSQSYPWVDADPDEELPRPSRVQNVSKRTNQTNRMPVRPPLQPSSPEADEDDLPPIYDRSTRDIPSPSTANQAGAAAYIGTMGTREPQPLPLSPQRPQASKTVKPGLKKRPETGTRRKVTSKITSPRVTGKIPLSARQQQSKQSKKKSNSSTFITVLAVVLILLIIGLVALLVPSADVTVTLPSHEYTLPMSLTANATSQQNTTLKTVPAHVLSFDTSVTGTGRATGTTTVGTIQADGTVSFSNNGGNNNQVIIPTGTIISTKSGIQFATQAEVLPIPGSLIPVPVKAQDPGVSGNVAAGSITVIPSSSIASIQQANPIGTVVNLSVTNTAPTTHGGAGNATSLSSKDVATEKSALDIQLQARVKDFLARNVLTGDQTGKMVQVETPTFSPKIGDVVNNGTFMETLRLHMTVLVVRAADLQTAAAAQLKDTLAKAKTGSDLVPQQPVQLKQVKNTSPSNGSSVKLSFTAVGQVAPRISADTVRNLVYGKSVDGAQQALVGRNGIPNATHPVITVNPSFFHFVPFWTQRITVHFKTVLQPTTPSKKTTTPKSR